MRALIDHVSEIIAINEDLSDMLKNSFEPVEFGKNHCCIKLNSKCDTLFFINKGALRGYHYEDGKEVTDWFAQEGEFATCFYAFISQKNSTEQIEVLEDSVLTPISFQQLQVLYDRFPVTERIGRLITENYYIKLEERLQNLKLKSAKERYSHLLESNPTLLNRASLGQIASYLGISQETLSRIRAEL